MNIFPSDYSKLDLSQNEKRLIKIISEGLVSKNDLLLVNINPAGIPHKVLALIKNGTLSFIHILDSFKTKEEFNSFVIDNLSNILESNIKKIFFRLTEHSDLILKNGVEKILKFPISYKYLAVEINEILNENCAGFICSNNIFISSIKANLHDNYSDSIICSLTDNLITPYPKDYSYFTDDDVTNILQMIAPEYTIPLKHCKKSLSKHYSENQIINNASFDYTISENDFQTNSLRLDAEQINIVNTIRKGNQLILASAGSGKSVLLISKLFKVASIHPDKNFLLLCYNKNLASMYNWKIAISGFRERNVKAMTFHKFLNYLLEKNKVKYGNYTPEEMFDIVLNHFDEGRILDKYFGIFIDEIQIFKPEWYRFCFELLDNKDQDNYFLTICGDISQNVRNDVKQGSAPWQGHEGLPNFRGRTLHIKRNYRNSIEINNFIKALSRNAKSMFEKFNVVLEEKEDIFLDADAFKHGPAPRIIETSRYNVIQKVLDEVKYLLSKGLQASDIAILFPQRQYKKYDYFIHFWLETELKKHGYPFSNLIQAGDRMSVDYADYSGIALSTIESALGLDFEAIILTGLPPLGAYYESKKISKKLSDNEESIHIKEEFIESVNKIYTACTRARTNLSIILEEDEENSIFSHLIKMSNIDLGA